MPVYESLRAPADLPRPVRRLGERRQTRSRPSFPALGDMVGADPVQRPGRPRPSRHPDRGGESYERPSDGRATWAANNVFTLGAVDTGGGKGFPAARPRRRGTGSTPTRPPTPGPGSTATLGQTFTITGADGRTSIDVQAADPCHTFADEAGADGRRPARCSAAVVTVSSGSTPPPPVASPGRHPALRPRRSTRTIWRHRGLLGERRGRTARASRRSRPPSTGGTADPSCVEHHPAGGRRRGAGPVPVRCRACAPRR